MVLQSVLTSVVAIVLWEQALSENDRAAARQAAALVIEALRHAASGAGRGR